MTHEWKDVWKIPAPQMTFPSAKIVRRKKASQAKPAQPKAPAKTKSKAKPKSKGKRHQWTAAEKAAIGKRMKAYWAKRRKGKG